MAIRYTQWLDPDADERHRAAESALETWFFERFADYPHIRLFGADPYDYDAPFNRLYDVLIARAASYIEREQHYVATPEQLSRAFYRAVARSTKFVRDRPNGDPSRNDS